MDLDSTVMERFGEQEGVLPGYNPRRHRRPTHHPLLAGLAKLRLVRADNGFFDGKFLDYLEEKSLPHLIKARLTKWVKFAVLSVSEWRRVGKGIEVGEAHIQLMGWSRGRRLVVIRQEIATKESKALGKKLFECQGFTFQGIVTSMSVEEMDATTAYRTYNGRADFENRIEELKAGCGLEGFCMDSYTATECVLRTLCLVHSLIQHFQGRIGLRPSAAPEGEGKRHMLETLRHSLFTCAAILGRSGRNKVLRLSLGDVWLHGFHAALTRLLAPLSICKADPNEGPLMALMV